MQKVKVTKKQRKMARQNQMVKDSMKGGDQYLVGDRVYYGSNPEYSEMQHPLTLQNIVIKTANGIPFVRKW